ncbi:MAG: hypothetical protein M3232_01545 [Thermoproteota archaeon]|nr:hypothetical protein [Thermoproteota archaeon]
MLSCSIAMQATVSMAIMNMASLISTTTKEFRENTCNIMAASAQSLHQQATTTSGAGVATNK